MLKKSLLIVNIMFVVTMCENGETENKTKIYKPKWADLDTRPLPEWFDKAKIGIFIHWGLYSVPGVNTEWFWNKWDLGKPDEVEYMKKYFPPNFNYRCFAPMFTAEFFDPDYWAEIFANSGAKYVILTAKHHDGYTLFPSKYSPNWNSVHIGPNRDLVGELATAVLNKDLEFGLYYSLYEWHNVLYDSDKYEGTRLYTERKMFPELKQLIDNYAPSVLWGDGEWDSTVDYWNTTHFIAWLYNESPVRDKIVINDRWGSARCLHGDFYNCDDRYNPGSLQSKKWENAFTLDLKSWGHRRNMKSTDVATMEELLPNIISTVSCGGNVLINIGPTKEGTIPVIFQDRLMKLGNWLSVNGEAIYGTSPWFHQFDLITDNVWFTCVKQTFNGSNPTGVPTSNEEILAVYAIFLDWPQERTLSLGSAGFYFDKLQYDVQMLGYGKNLNYTDRETIVVVDLPDKAMVTTRYAWVLKFSNFKERKRHFINNGFEDTDAADHILTTKKGMKVLKPETTTYKFVTEY